MSFDPKVTSNQECIITTFQDVYFVSDSFEEAKVKMRSVPRPGIKKEINLKAGLGDDSEVISGSLPRPSSVPSRCGTTLTPRAWTSSKTPPASTAWWRSCGTSWTSSAMPSVGWTSSWASDRPPALERSPLVRRHPPSSTRLMCSASAVPTAPSYRRQELAQGQRAVFTPDSVSLHDSQHSGRVRTSSDATDITHIFSSSHCQLLLCILLQRYIHIFCI